MADPQPFDAALWEYVRGNLARIGSSFAENDVVQEALTLHRDLWERLYELDRAEPEHLAEPS